ncbi:protein phosphatase 2C domain-containing protein [Streptomyces sp. NPDC029041]|uniref:protein phosphatase 2C domain-containing protein n=1 Tax=Streptomyces sp. NPDC029041 TaxID=3155727 RepID=UPI0033E7B1AA
MSQQGGRPTGREDDWWRELYDDSADDTGPAPARDSLDDRFASASGAVADGTQGRTGPSDRSGSSDRPSSSDRPGSSDRPAARGFGAGPVVPAPRTGADDLPDAPRPNDGPSHRAPWEPPRPGPTGPVSFPASARPPQRPGRPPAHAPSDERPGPSASVSASQSSGQPPAPTVPDAETPRIPPPPTVPPTWPSPQAHPATGAAAPAPPTTAPGESAPRPPAAEPAHAASPTPTDRPPVPPRPTDSPPVPPPPTAAPSEVPPPPATAPAPAPDEHSPRIERPAPVSRSRGHVGTRPPTYDAEPTALPAADPDDLDDLVADTVLDGARYGACTVRAVSQRGDSARYRGEPRRDALLTARFGAGEHALLLVAMATGARAAPGAHRAAAEACHWIGRAVGRSHARLVEDIRDGRRGDLKSGLHRLTDRSLGKLRASASEQGVDPGEYAASLRCLLLSADPECRTRVFFGVGPGGLFRLREGEWQDIEPHAAEVKGDPVMGFGSPPSETPEGDRLTMDLGIPTPPSPYEPAPEPPREPFRFRTSVARPGDTLLMCTGGLADPLRGEPELGEYLAERWSRPEPPGLAAFLADSQVRVKGYADDRTAAAVWEA